MSSRRDFLKQTGVGSLIAGSSAGVGVQSDQRIQLGMIGPGGMGSHHLRSLVKRDDVDIVSICDVDGNRLSAAVDVVTKAGKRPAHATTDLRRVLDNQSIDAVFIATPDHWHGPATLLALDAGKHVYVEKPCCHNIHEGTLMARAVERTGKQLQVGTQSRSTACVHEAIQRVHEGEIGEVLVAKAWNSQRRGSIGKRPPQAPPKHLDFDTWIGPAPVVPYQTNLLHANWRWWYEFGCGDIGNDGVHDIDVALWGLNPGRHPDRATCFGHMCFFDDDQQFPDTQYAVFEYASNNSQSKPRQLIFEQRIWSPYSQDGYGNGAAFYGTKGVMVVGHTTGWQLYGPQNKLIAERTGRVDLRAHHSNFFDSIRGSGSPTAGITQGHQAATIVHLANIAARLGRVLEFDSERESILNDKEAQSMVKRSYRDHWATPTYND